MAQWCVLGISHFKGVVAEETEEFQEFYEETVEAEDESVEVESKPNERGDYTTFLRKPNPRR